MTAKNNKLLLLAIALFILLNVLLEFLSAYFFGGEPIKRAAIEFGFYISIGVICFVFWFVGIKILHLDATGPVPWYASPVLWLSPVFVITLVIMFSEGV